MKFVVNSSDLSERLQTLNRAINTKNQMPILSNFLIEVAEGGEITLVASDTEVRISTKFQALETEGSATFTANAKALLEAVKAIPDQPITLYVEDNLSMTLQYQNGKFAMMGESAEEYPKQENLADCKEMELSAAILARSIGRAQRAAADDVLRPQLNCVYFDIRKDNISMVSSDGNRLAATTTNYESEEESNFLLPKKAALIVMGIALKGKDTAKISYTARRAKFEVDSYTIDCRLLESRFPNWRSVIPQNENSAVVDKSSLQSLIRRVMVFANQDSTLLCMTFADNKVKVVAQDVDYNKSAEETLLIEYTGAPITIGFKGEAFADMLNCIDTKEVVIKLADPSRAGVIKPSEDKPSEEVTLLLMPMVINA